MAVSSENPQVFFPCPVCGFLVFDEGPGSYEICPICAWEDDAAQLEFPALRVGANSQSLPEQQQAWLRIMPPDVAEYDGYRRDPTWRPLRPEEIETGDIVPQSGTEYFEAVVSAEGRYYWKR
jgi:hypothetical protein